MFSRPADYALRHLRLGLRPPSSYRISRLFLFDTGTVVRSLSCKQWRKPKYPGLTGKLLRRYTRPRLVVVVRFRCKRAVPISPGGQAFWSLASREGRGLSMPSSRYSPRASRTLGIKPHSASRFKYQGRRPGIFIRRPNPAAHCRASSRWLHCAVRLSKELSGLLTPPGGCAFY